MLTLHVCVYPRLTDSFTPQTGPKLEYGGGGGATRYIYLMFLWFVTGGKVFVNVCVLFTSNPYFYPSTSSSTPSVRVDSSPNVERDTTHIVIKNTAQEILYFATQYEGEQTKRTMPMPSYWIRQAQHTRVSNPDALKERKAPHPKGDFLKHCIPSILSSIHSEEPLHTRTRNPTGNNSIGYEPLGKV